MKSDKQKEGINAAAALNDKTNSLYSRMLLYAAPGLTAVPCARTCLVRFKAALL